MDGAKIMNQFEFELNKMGPQLLDELAMAETGIRQVEKLPEKYEKLSRLLIGNLSEGIWIIDKNGYTIFVNPRMAEMFGYTVNEMMGRHLFSFMDEHGVEICKYYLERRKQGVKEHLDFEFIRKDGTQLYTSMETSPITDDTGNYIGAIAGVMDISENKLLEKKLRENERRYRGLYESIKDGIASYDMEDNIIDTNHAFLDMLGYTRKEIKEFTYQQLTPKKWHGMEEDIIKNQVMVRGYSDEYEKELIKKDGAVFPISIRVWLMNDENGISSGMWAIVRDITERKQAEEQLQKSEGRFRYISYHDSLTGLYSRTFFSEEMARLGRDLSRSTPLSIISIDVDGLKLVNDAFGHHAGDKHLIAVAKILSMSFRSVDIVARTGGDEFCIILPGADNRTALARRNRIRALIDKYNAGYASISISLSIGVATLQGVKGENIYDLYMRADNDMYEYKIRQVGNSRMNVVDVLLGALAERDYVAQGHVERLSMMAKIVAERMNLSDEEKNNLLLLTKVHDIGNLGIPDQILFKSGMLSEEEFERIKKHPQLGYNIASRLKELSHVAHLILHHHECWNGTGYPTGLSEGEIPLECRILSIIDAYDAMTGKRRYRKAISREEALAELRRCSGTKYEPGLVDEFVDIMKAKGISGLHC